MVKDEAPQTIKIDRPVYNNTEDFHQNLDYEDPEKKRGRYLIYCCVFNIKF